MLEIFLAAVNPIVFAFYFILLVATLKGYLAPKMSFSLLGISFATLLSYNSLKLLDRFTFYNQPVPLSETIFLKLEGINDKDFKTKLSTRIGYGFKRTGTFILKVTYTGTLDKIRNEQLGRLQYKYQAGSITVSIEGEPCIGIGEINLPISPEEGITTKTAIEEIQAKRIVLALDNNMDFLAEKIKACMYDIIN